MRLIERDFYLNKLKNVMGTPDIKVITGVRRSGKSKLLESFMAYVREANPNANIIHINFNLNTYESLAEYHALNDYVENAYIAGKDNFVMIDEVQMCGGFEKVINSLHASEKYDIFHIAIDDPDDCYRRYSGRIADTFGRILGERSLVSTLDRLPVTILDCIDAAGRKDGGQEEAVEWDTGGAEAPAPAGMELETISW